MKNVYDPLVWHDDQESLFRKFVCLKLVVGAVHASTACQEEKQFGRPMGIVGGLCDIYFDVIEFGYLLPSAASFSISYIRCSA